MSARIARHRATPVRNNPFGALSKAVSSHKGSVGRGAVVVTAVSGMMLGAGAPAMAGAGPSTTPAPAYAPAAAAAPAPAAAVMPAPVAAPTQVETAGAINHTVRSGDTLGAISANYSVSLSSVLQLNGLNMTAIIYPGDVIRVSGSSVAPAAPAPVAQAAVAPAAVVPAPVAPAPVGAPQQQAMAAWAPAASPSNTGEVMSLSSNITPISTASSSASGSAIAAAAQSQLGQFQDCTALVERALRAAGVAGVGDESPESLLGFATPTSNPQPGDLVYYADGGVGFSHIAVYIGGGQAVHGGWFGNQTVTYSVDVGSGPSYFSVNG